MKIMARGTAGTLGDLFLLSHFLYNVKINGHDVYVACPDNLSPDLQYLMSCHTLFSGIITLKLSDFIDDVSFHAYSVQNGYEPLLYLHDIDFIRNTAFYELPLWFKCDRGIRKLPEGHYVGVQVASSSNWSRPPIPHLEAYIRLLEASNLSPVFMGTAKDEGIFRSYYPSISEKYSSNDILWRFGKDTVFDTIFNIKHMDYCLVFSSWVAYVAVLQGVTTLELWSESQFQYYTGIVSRMLGNPIHYLQDRYTAIPSQHIFSDIMPHLRNLGTKIYG